MSDMSTKPAQAISEPEGPGQTSESESPAVINLPTTRIELSSPAPNVTGKHHPFIPDSDITPPIPNRCSIEEAAAPPEMEFVLKLGPQADSEDLSKAEIVRIWALLREIPGLDPDADPELLQSPHNIPVQLPPVPALALTVGQPYFFGWPVTPAWLTAFTICCTNGKTAYPTETDAFNELRTRSGFRYLSIDPVVHGNAPVWPGLEDPPPGVAVFKIISICNTRREKYYAESRRPTQAQYAWLAKFLPGEPQWYRSLLSMQEWVDVDGVLATSRFIIPCGE